MTLNKRLDKIEQRLTPKQEVVLWLQNTTTGILINIEFKKSLKIIRNRIIIINIPNLFPAYYIKDVLEKFVTDRFHNFIFYSCHINTQDQY